MSGNVIDSYFWKVLKMKYKVTPIVEYTRVGFNVYSQGTSFVVGKEQQPGHTNICAFLLATCQGKFNALCMFVHLFYYLWLLDIHASLWYTLQYISMLFSMINISRIEWFNHNVAKRKTQYKWRRSWVQLVELI